MFRGKFDRSKLHYFDKKGNTFALKDDVKKAVQFARLNIIEDFSFLGPFHIVLCRNVLCNFSQQIWREYLDKLSAVMYPGGYLFLGAQEWIFGDSSQFELVEAKNCVYYRKR